MKKYVYLIALSSVVMLSSCVTTVKTARSAETSASIRNATVADLQVTEKRITYTTTPSKEIQRAGLSNVKQAAIQEALTANGNADVMVEPEFVISMKNKFLFGKEVSSITVTGRPAYFKNFRTLNDTVWATPGFYGQPKVVNQSNTNNTALGKSTGGVFGGILGILGITGKKSSSESLSEAKYAARSGWNARIEAIGGIQKMKGVDDNHYKSDANAYTGGYLTIGYNITPNVFIGAGTGCSYDFKLDYTILPVFGNARFYLAPTKSSLFVDVKIGGGTVLGKKDIKGGVFVNPAIGYSFGNVEIALTYAFQRLKYEYDNYYYNKYYSYSSHEKAKFNINRFGLSLALSL